jgi:hypothetical protein
MREFVSAGGELIIHGALHPKNSAIPDLNRENDGSKYADNVFNLQSFEKLLNQNTSVSA